MSKAKLKALNKPREKRKSTPQTNTATKNPCRNATTTERTINSCFKNKKRMMKPIIEAVPVTETIKLIYIKVKPSQLVVSGLIVKSTMPNPSQAAKVAMVINAK